MIAIGSDDVKQFDDRINTSCVAVSFGSDDVTSANARCVDVDERLKGSTAITTTTNRVEQVHSNATFFARFNLVSAKAVRTSAVSCGEQTTARDFTARVVLERELVC